MSFNIPVILNLYDIEILKVSVSNMIVSNPTDWVSNWRIGLCGETAPKCDLILVFCFFVVSFCFGIFLEGGRLVSINLKFVFSGSSLVYSAKYGLKIWEAKTTFLPPPLPATASLPPTPFLGYLTYLLLTIYPFRIIFFIYFSHIF